MNLSVSQILSETMGIVRSRFWPLVGMYLAWFALMMAFAIVMSLAMGGSMLALGGAMDTGGDPFSAGLGVGFIVMMVVFYVGYILIACAQNAAMCTLASPLRSNDFGGAFGTGIRAALPLLGVILLMLVAYFAFAMVIGVAAAALSQIGTAGMVILGIAVVLLVLWLGARLGIVMAVVPVDEVRNPIRAIGRAWSLTSGNALSIFLAFLAFMVIAVVLFGIVALPFIGTLSSLEPGSGGAPAVGSMIFMFIGFIVVALVVAVAYSALLSSIHALLTGPTNAAEAFE